MHFNITPEVLRKIAGASTSQKVVEGIVKYLPEIFERYEINTPLRVAHFLAQAAWESDHFRTLTEYASGREYEGRRDLGNRHRGDGVRYKGRGAFQLTGKANYTEYGHALSLDLVNNPEWAATPHVSMLVAGEYWKRKNLNHWADQDNGRQITRIINGGYNGLEGRLAMVERAKKAIHPVEIAMLDDHPFDGSIENEVHTEGPMAEPAPVPVPEPVEEPVVKKIAAKTVIV